MRKIPATLRIGVVKPTEAEALFISVKTAAELCAISPKTFYEWLDTPDGPPHRRFGRIVRIPYGAFIKWAENSQGQTV